MSNCQPLIIDAEILDINSIINAMPEKIDEEWHQCPEAVRNYVANVDYTDVPYTVSSISSYAPSTPAPSINTKPIGKTIDGVTYYNNIPSAKTPFASANKAGTVMPLDQVRWINTKTTNNFRDIGGWACDGGTVKYGLIYRSGNPHANDEDLIINQLGINTEIDLTADEVPAYSGKMRYICYPSYAMYTLGNAAAWQTNLRGVFDAVIYRDPVLIHCSMGADRTATLVCILEGLLGMSQSDLDKDYELTSFYSERARNGNYQGGTADWAHLIAAINSLSGSTFRDRCVSFVLSLGFTIGEINAFRSAMIDGNPPALDVPTATVTGTYINCATSNNSTSVAINDAYAATITANSGYTLVGASVSVFMDGSDITSSAYSNGVISIADVTGDITINIEATSNDQRIELFDPSAATLNVRFDSSGATTARDGNFVTDFIPVSGINTSEPWRIHIKEIGNSSKFRASAQYESVLYCNSDKSLINSNYGRLTVNTVVNSANSLCKHSDGEGGIYIDINRTGDGEYIPSNYFDVSQVAYIRLCMTYSSSAIASTAALANVSIKADKINS